MVTLIKPFSLKFPNPYSLSFIHSLSVSQSFNRYSMHVRLLLCQALLLLCCDCWPCTVSTTNGFCMYFLLGKKGQTVIFFFFPERTFWFLMTFHWMVLHCHCLCSSSEAAPDESDQMLGEVEALSVELKHYIQEDNWRFEQEVEEWEEEQSCKIPQMESSTSSASQDFSTSQGSQEDRSHQWASGARAAPPQAARAPQLLEWCRVRTVSFRSRWHCTTCWNNLWL